MRTDNQKFLRASDFGETGERADSSFYFWDEATRKPVKAPATGFGQHPAAPQVPREPETLALNGLKPALEGRWKIKTPQGKVEVTTVFELTRQLCNRDYTPEKAQQITGVHADNIRTIARSFAKSGAGMIYAGYRSCKWLHGDKLHRAWLLMCALTGDTGRPGGGMQTTQLGISLQFALQLIDIKADAETTAVERFKALSPRLHARPISSRGSRACLRRAFRCTPCDPAASRAGTAGQDRRASSRAHTIRRACSATPRASSRSSRSWAPRTSPRCSSKTAWSWWANSTRTIVLRCSLANAGA